MMPFCTLVMIESRFIRMLDELKTEIGAAVFAEIAEKITSDTDKRGARHRFNYRIMISSNKF